MVRTKLCVAESVVQLCTVSVYVKYNYLTGRNVMHKFIQCIHIDTSNVLCTLVLREKKKVVKNRQNSVCSAELEGRLATTYNSCSGFRSSVAP